MQREVVPEPRLRTASAAGLAAAARDRFRYTAYVGMPGKREARLEVVIVTGLSGSGKSTAIDVLEDLGFYCIDNLPVVLIQRFLELC